jgi:hypothetical protein
MTDSPIVLIDGSPGDEPCLTCGEPTEFRTGYCYACAWEGQRRAANRSVVQHVLHGFGRIFQGRFDFGTRMDFVWAWCRMTRTGDYAPGGEFERQYFSPDSTPVAGKGSSFV